MNIILNKNIFFIFICMFCATYGMHAQDYMEIITEKSCACLDKIPNEEQTDQLHLKLGICMLEAADPYKKQLKNEYGIELDKNDDSGEKLGRIIGLKMAVKCPSALMKMAGRSDDMQKEEKSVRGNITKIEAEQFVCFSVRDEQGKTAKYYWLTFVESSADLIAKYKTYSGKNIRITYRNEDFFDPKIDEYRSFSIILKMEIVE